MKNLVKLLSSKCKDISNMNISTKHILIFLLLAPMFFFTVMAQNRPSNWLGQSDWRKLVSSPGVEIGGGNADMVILCDVHCPYCAKLYVKLRGEHKTLKFRWVPVSYFWSNSGEVAAAIIASNNPEMSLDKNYYRYDYKRQRGWFGIAGVHQYSLGSNNAAVQQMWRTWGGYTPMIVVRNALGDVQKMQDASDSSLLSAIKFAGK